MSQLKTLLPAPVKRRALKIIGQSRVLKQNFVKGRIAFHHRLSGVRPIHLVISGCSRSGTTMLYNMIRSSATESIYMPDRELSALDTYNRRERRIVTKWPLDIFRIDEIDKELGSQRDILHLMLIRDPRDLVSSKHSSVPSQFFQGYDYQFFVRPNGKSFTGPGIAAVADAIDHAGAEGRRVLVIRYEDLVQDPEYVRRVIAFATGFRLTKPFATFHVGNIPEDLSVQLNGVRPVDAPDRPAWTKGERYRRACRQLELFPEMEELAVRWGYSATHEVRQTHDIPEMPTRPEHGTIVAFHTDDAFYTAEAARCKKRLEQLGLKHDFVSVPKNGSWVENCARKPEFLLDVRQRLRGPLLYIDVDAFVHRDPWAYLADFDGDMAAYVHCDGKLWSGTILINDTQGAMSLLRDWRDRQKVSSNIYDQVVLQETIERDEKGQKKYRFFRLPPELTLIADREYPYVYGKALVEHLQASRVSKHGRRGDAMMSRIQTLEAITEASGSD